MVVTGRVQDLIMNPEETGKITEVISEGDFYGMQTFDQALLGYVQDGAIAEAVALETASSPHDFKLMLSARGQRASGIEQVAGNGAGDDEPAPTTLRLSPFMPASALKVGRRIAESTPSSP